MTTLYITNITDAISKLSISGITVKDKDEIPAAFEGSTYVLYLNPENWIENMTTTYNILGQLETLSYTLNYRLLTVQIGGPAIFTKAFSDLVDKLSTVVGAIVDTINPYSSDVEMKIAASSPGVKTDPSGNTFYGADISLSIEESHG